MEVELLSPDVEIRPSQRASVALLRRCLPRGLPLWQICVASPRIRSLCIQPPGAATRLPEDLTTGPGVPSQDAKSDLVNVLSSLEAHWHVLEAEVVEINRDIDYCEQCLRKYGEWFNSPLQYLRELKRSKKNKMKEIIRTMESFNNNLQGGKRLVKSLEKQAVSSTGHLPLP